ncbi:MAG: oligosaccharide flippase family protein [Clostridia bacterium]|nr:oligosaccharide flippase family protein [Clostridia bacterium]
MNKSRVQAVAFNTTVGIIQKVVTVIANLVIQIIFVRTLGEQYAGISALFTSVLTVLAFADLGIGTAIIYNLYKPIAEKNYEKIHAYLHFYSTAYRIVSLVVILGGIVALPLLPFIVIDVPAISENINIIFLLFVADTAVSYLYVYKATFLNACQENYVVSAVHSVAIICKTIGIAVFLTLFKSYYAYLVFSIITTFMQNIVVSLIADKKYSFLKEKSKTRLNKGEKKQIYNNVFAMSLYKVSGTVLNSTDNIIISNMSGTVQVGLLSNQILIVRQIYDVVIQFFSSVTSSVGNLSTENRTDYENKILNTLRFIAFWIFMFCSISIFVLSPPFIKLAFGEQYIVAYPVLFFMCFDFYVKGMINPVSAFRTSHGLFVQGKYRPLIMAVLNIILSVFFMKLFGIFGVFAATVVSRLLTQFWFDPYIVYKHIFNKNPTKYFVKSIIWFLFTCVVGGLTWYIASFVTTQSLILNIFLKAIVCILVPNILVIVFFCKTEEFKKTVSIVLQLFKGITSRFKRRGKVSD